MTARIGRTSRIAALARYEPTRPPVRLDLSDNTSLFGPPPSARSTLASLTDEHLTRYPTPYADRLVAALSAHHGVDADRVTTGCGSDDVLDSAMRACAEAGTVLAVAVPTFSVIPTFASLNDLDVAAVEWRRDGTLDAEGMLSTRAALHYVCSPNNPTGSQAARDALEALLEGTDAVVLLDEAYVDFADGDALALTATYDNLVIVRTLSKAYGLAALRLGYAIGSPRVIGPITSSRGPYKVGTLAEAVAVNVLEHDGDWVRERIDEVVALRDGFIATLRDRGHEVLGSQANFVAISVDDAPAVRDAMLARGVLVRAYRGLEAVGDVVRVTIGPAPLLAEALEALEAALA